MRKIDTDRALRMMVCIYAPPVNTVLTVVVHVNNDDDALQLHFLLKKSWGINVLRGPLFIGRSRSVVADLVVQVTLTHKTQIKLSYF